MSLLIGLLFLAMPACGQTVDTSSSPLLFAGADLSEIQQPYHLELFPGQATVARWHIDWGDGTQSTEGGASPESVHSYAKVGRYAVRVQGFDASGAPIPTSYNYGEIVQQDHPLATNNGIVDGKPSADTSRFLAAIAVNASPYGGPANLIVPAQAVDQFSIEFWLRPQDVTARQVLFETTGSPDKPTRLYIQDHSLCLALPGGDIYIHPLGPDFQLGTWHHIAVTYDRDPMFPYSNVARFYSDGLLAGQYHLDRYDTGPVTLETGSIGRGTPNGDELKGSMAAVAVYDRWLNPARIRDRVRIVSQPDTLIVTAVPKNADNFTVDPPNIQRTVEVALNPDPTTDNGPILRAAIEGAQPGTRLRIVNEATHAPGGRFYFSSLDSGQDWTALRFFRKTDFELDGGGADFVFRTSVRQLTVKQSTRIAFRNFSIDLDQDKYRVACYAQILDVDPATGTVRMQFINGRDRTPDRRVPPGISMWRWRSHDPKTLRILNGTGMFFQTGEVFHGGMQRDPADPSIVIGHTTNAKMLAAFAQYRAGANFLMVNNSDFRNTSVSLWEHCSQVTFDHVNFYATLGMVFLSSEYDHMLVTHCRIGPPPGETAADRPLASGADGFHFHENSGHTLFEDNEITLTDDDPISIKDGIWRDVTASGANTIHIKDFHPGEEIELYNNDLSPLNFTAKVVAVHGGDITVDTPLPANLPASFLAQNHRERSFNWILRDNYCHDYYGRFLVYTPWARITGNTITKSYLHVGTGAASFDGGGISSHVLVDDNILVETNADTGLWGINSSYPVFQDIAFANNSFIRCDLNLNNTGNALVAGNYFEGVTSKSPGPANAVSLHHSFDPQVLGNLQAGIGILSFGLASTTTDGLQSADNRCVAFRSDESLEAASR